jgi:hypothetical protein
VAEHNGRETSRYEYYISCTAGLQQPTDPPARCFAIPEDAVADVEPVRLRIAFGQLDLGDRPAIRGIQLVDDPALLHLFLFAAPTPGQVGNRAPFDFAVGAT